MANFTQGFEYIACTKGHTVSVYVRADHAFVLGGVRTTGVEVGNWVAHNVPNSQAIYDRLERNRSMAEATPNNIKAARSTAACLVKSLAHDYGLEFMTGQRAGMERFITFDPINPDLWAKFISGPNQKGVHTKILLEAWEEHWSRIPNDPGATPALMFAAVMRQLEKEKMDRHSKLIDGLFK